MAISLANAVLKLGVQHEAICSMHAAHAERHIKLPPFTLRLAILMWLLLLLLLLRLSTMLRSPSDVARYITAPSADTSPADQLLSSSGTPGSRPHTPAAAQQQQQRQRTQSSCCYM
jgi:hypothetical protein